MKPTPAPWGYYVDGNFVEINRQFYAYCGHFPPFQIHGEAGVMHDVVELGAVEKVANKRSKAAKENTSAVAGTRGRKAVLDAIKERVPNVTLFRNNNGECWQGEWKKLSSGSVVILRAYRMKYGFGAGSGDDIGYTKVVITQEMVGMTMAQFTMVESKYGSGDESTAQEEWRDMVNDDGGRALVIHDAAEVSPDMFHPLHPRQVVRNKVRRNKPLNF